MGALHLRTFLEYAIHARPNREALGFPQHEVHLALGYDLQAQVIPNPGRPGLCQLRCRSWRFRLVALQRRMSQITEAKPGPMSSEGVLLRYRPEDDMHEVRMVRLVLNPLSA